MTRALRTLSLVALAIFSSACLFSGSGTTTDDSTNVDRREDLRRTGKTIGQAKATEVARAAARAQGEEQPAIDKFHLTTSANATELLGLQGKDLSVAEGDLVYAVAMGGDFTFSRAEDTPADRMFVIVDAYTGDVLSVGALP